MKLAPALRVKPGMVVTFIGAGGKSSAKARLARELAGSHGLVLTTTTKVAIDQVHVADSHAVVDRQEQFDLAIESAGKSRVLFVTGERNAAGDKWTGVPRQWIEANGSRLKGVGTVCLVEGDGARRRLIKAPADHEPVVPENSELVVVVASLAAVGLPLTEEIAHREERVSELAGLPLGQVFQVQHLARLMTSEQGLLKGVPAAAETRVLLTQVTSSIGEEEVAALAEACLRETRIRAVVAADLGSTDPVSKCYGRVAGVVLAAGGASRMGQLKQVMRWRGTPLVRRAVQAALEGGLAPLVLVVGAEAESVRAAAGAGVTAVVNPEWQSGQSSSLKRGLEAVEGGIEAAVFLLADMPLVAPDLVATLVREHRESLASIVAPRAGDRWGNPVLFDRDTFADLAQVKGDQGGKALFSRYEVRPIKADLGSMRDIDEPGDWSDLDVGGDASD